MTPDERRRALEVMARASWNDERDPEWDKRWDKLNAREKRAWLATAEAALTALLKIADVKMKEPSE